MNYKVYTMMGLTELSEHGNDFEAAKAAARSQGFASIRLVRGGVDYAAVAFVGVEMAYVPGAVQTVYTPDAADYLPDMPPACVHPEFHRGRCLCCGAEGVQNA
jgi:hypothetical protein